MIFILKKDKNHYMCIKFIIKANAKSWRQKSKAFIKQRKKQRATNKQIPLMRKIFPKHLYLRKENAMIHAKIWH